MSDEAELAALNAEQRTALAFFREVTANERDLRGCLNLLTTCDWNAERALQLHYASGEEEPARGSISSAAGAGGGLRDLGTPLLQGASAGGSSGSASAPAGGDQGGGNQGGGGEGFFLGWMVGSLKAVGAGILGIVRMVLLFGLGRGSALRGGGSSGEAFRATLIDSYGGAIVLPRFFNGSFHEALQAARRDVKLLVVFLHSDQARYAQTFITQVLSNEFIRSVIDENFVFWGGDIAWMETHEVAQMIHARQYPHICVLLPMLRGDELRAIGALQGNVEVDAGVALFTTCLEEMEMHRSEILANTAQQVEDRSLRQEQDKEYQEALALDRKREEERQAEAIKTREVEDAEAERVRQEKASAASLEQQRQDIVARRQQRAAELDPEGLETTARIALRLPAGQRVQRKFRPEARLREVYAWAECCGYLPENADRGVDVPLRFVLKTTFPARELTEMEATVQDLQLSGTNILLAQIEDDD